MKLLAIDVGGTEIKSALIDQDYSLSDWDSIPTPQNSFDDFLSAIETIYSRYKDQIEGVAMALPGFIDSDQGLCNSGGALTYNAGKYLGPILSERLGCRVHLENDGKAAAMAELANGSLKGCKNAAVFIIGTGVGGGLIVDGKLVKGRNFTAGELSFLTVSMELDKGEGTMDGMMCDYCSTPALLNFYNRFSGTEETINGREFFRRYHENDPAAVRALDLFSRYVAIQVMNLGVLLNCERVAIGGGISRQPVLVKKINEMMDTIGVNMMIARNKTTNYMRPEVVNCQFSNDANLIGAAYSYLISQED